MVIDIPEIKKRAIAFSYDWKDETKERAEAQTFWNEFFKVFDLERRRFAIFDESVTMLNGETGFIDLIWKGYLIVEHKSIKGDLDKAYTQALGYYNGLSDSQLPKFVIVTNFKRMRLYDEIKQKIVCEFDIINLVDNIHFFDFMSNHESVPYEKEDPVSIKASMLMGKLHDSLKDSNYVGHELEIFLVRVMFCLFADDTDIFEKSQFRQLIKNTDVSGYDVGRLITELFVVLNTPKEKRQKTLDVKLMAFEYIDGNLFEDRIDPPSFDSTIRNNLLECCHFNWGLVSPAIFGSLFQSVMNQEERHSLGGHYTSEQNIQKTIDSLFLDELKREYDTNKNNKQYLQSMLDKIGRIKILDPACGCGNFLMIAYRELREIQINIHVRMRELEDRSKTRLPDEKHKQSLLEVSFDTDLNVDSMYGIEKQEFSARIAQVGLWLIDHLVNRELRAFGVDYKRLPLKKTANITIGNSLRTDWNKIIPKDELTYIVGNPPFISKQDRNPEQQEDMDLVCNTIKNNGILDYVCCWYIKVADYIQDTKIKAAFVSTNSITQGEQVGVLWKYLNQKGIRINFAHRTFKWTNDAHGKASVYVVIIGFALFDEPIKSLFSYPKPDSEPLRIRAKNINAYLIDQKDMLIFNRTKPVCNVPEICFGNMPNDDGNFLFNDSEKIEFLKDEPNAKGFIRPFLSAREFLHDEKRWCLWLDNANSGEIDKLPKVIDRIKKVKEYRLSSKREATRKLAEKPSLFGEIRQPESDYILIPRHSSEHRNYIPMGFFSKENIAADSCLTIPNATLYQFGILMSSLHMSWVNQICGRLESRYRYSNGLVYNNYPWAENPKPEQVKEVEKCAKLVIETRKKQNCSLADMYNPLSPPKELLKAHKNLDRAVEKCYRSKPFKSDMERVGFLFELYDHYVNKGNNTP